MLLTANLHCYYVSVYTACGSIVLTKLSRVKQSTLQSEGTNHLPRYGLWQGRFVSSLRDQGGSIKSIHIIGSLTDGFEDYLELARWKEALSLQLALLGRAEPKIGSEKVWDVNVELAGTSANPGGGWTTCNFTGT